MKTDERLDLLDTAINNGAEVTINFHDLESEKAAKKLIKKFERFFNKPYVSCTKEESGGYKWFELEFYETGENNNICMSIFYEDKKELQAANNAKSNAALKGGGLYLG